MSRPAQKGATPAAAPSFSLVLFDLDDTLFAHTEAVGLGVKAHRSALGGAFADADETAELARWHALEEEHYHRYLAGDIDFLEQRRARVRGFVAPYGIELDDVAADGWYGDYYLEYERAWALYDDTLPCLDALNEALPGVRFGVVTNGELDYQSLKVTAVGLDRLFEHLIASGELDFAKPDARIFEHACSVFGVEPGSAAYVGDRLHTDAIGAANAGLTGVWLDRAGTASAEDLAAATASGVAVIRTLTELPQLLSGRTA
ncbi:HAD family hydrolase [Terrimesophilobacter mesophilus]|uniref:HAD family hydrolase n=2 Tax=Terrimesophilobacter mesophilus TaxID=433647 RepID=A0A4V3I9U8_9MICO|nr:HAD family hydrolase [Terrimesophilobacter mesophilus]